MIASTLCVDRTQRAGALDPKWNNWVTIGEVMATIYTNGYDPRWDEYHREYLQGLRLIDLFPYPFEMTSHLIPYEGDWMITKDQGSPGVAQSSTYSLQSTTLHQLESDEI